LRANSPELAGIRARLLSLQSVDWISGGRFGVFVSAPENRVSRRRRGDLLQLAQEVRRLRQLEEENGKLKKIVADLSLDKAMLQDVIRRKF
jgi:hypothetical protein